MCVPMRIVVLRVFNFLSVLWAFVVEKGLVIPRGYLCWTCAGLEGVVAGFKRLVFSCKKEGGGIISEQCKVCVGLEEVEEGLE